MLFFFFNDTATTEIYTLSLHDALPIWIEMLHFVEYGFGEIQTPPVDALVSGHPADRRFAGQGTTLHALHDPAQHAHILGESRPEEIAVGALAEPVHVKDARRLGEAALHADPVPEIVADVVSAEGQHRHRVAPHLADLSRRGGGRLRSHGGADIDAGRPVERLVHERSSAGAPAAESDGAHRKAFRALPIRIDTRALR